MYPLFYGVLCSVKPTPSSKNTLEPDESFQTNIQDKIFVDANNLTEADSGDYWCEVTVLENKTVQTKTAYITLPKFPDKIKYDKNTALPGLLILIVVCLAIVACVNFANTLRSLGVVTAIHRFVTEVAGRRETTVV